MFPPLGMSALGPVVSLRVLRSWPRRHDSPPPAACSESISLYDPELHLISRFILHTTMSLVCAEQRQDSLPVLWELAGQSERSER